MPWLDTTAPPFVTGYRWERLPINQSLAQAVLQLVSSTLLPHGLRGVAVCWIPLDTLQPAKLWTPRPSKHVARLR